MQNPYKDAYLIEFSVKLTKQYNTLQKKMQWWTESSDFIIIEKRSKDK